MKTNDLLSLADREENLLTADNWHASAVVMRLMAERLRILAARLRRHGMSTEEEETAPAGTGSPGKNSAG